MLWTCPEGQILICKERCTEISFRNMSSPKDLGLPKLLHSSQGDDYFHDNFSGCGGVLHSNNGTIRSPHWPQNFPENSRCSWTVITHQSKHLEVSFDNNFLIPSGDGQCQNSFVKVSVLVYLIGAKLVSGT